ncbi:MAG: hypothetical protein WAN76_10495 [Candidatus Sulfotelmatobacter sp.]
MATIGAEFRVRKWSNTGGTVLISSGAGAHPSKIAKGGAAESFDEAGE